MHSVLGLGTLVIAIMFVFGVRVAKFVVGAALILGALAFAYVMFRIASGTV